MFRKEDLPRGWEIKQLSDVCDVRDGTHDSPKYVSDGYPLITSKNVTNGYLNFSEVNLISKEDYDKVNKRSYVDDGDILMPMIGTIGKPIIVKKEREFAIKNVALIKFPEKTISNSYVKYILDGPIFKYYIQKTNRGITQRFLALKDIRSFPIPLPPVETQKKIVEILEKAEKLKEWRTESNELADNYLKSVFLEMFGDPINNPHNFKVGKIRDLIIKTQYGTSSKANEENKGYPILRMNNITYSGKWDFSSLKTIELDEKDKEKYLVYNGELLFNRTNSKELVGKAAVFRRDEPMAFAGYLVKILTDSPATSEYIAAHLNSPYGKAFLFNMAKSIVGMANINAKEVQRIPILIPPVELREQYAEIVKRHEDLREMQSQSKQELDNLFNTLMQKAFKGELVC